VHDIVVPRHVHKPKEKYAVKFSSSNRALEAFDDKNTHHVTGYQSFVRR
jgi:hypothetical protein